MLLCVFPLSRRAGLVAGLLGLFLGIGAMVFTNLNFALASDRGPARALLIVSFLTFMGSLPPILTFAWPPDGFAPTRGRAGGLSSSAGGGGVSGGKSPTAGSAAASAAANRYSSFGERAFKPLTRTAILRRAPFWLICGVVFVCLAPGWGLVSVYAPMFAAVSGGSHADATRYTTIANAAYTVGRLAWGALSDVIGNRTCYYVFLICQAALFALLPIFAKVLVSTQNCADGGDLIVFILLVCGSPSFFSSLSFAASFVLLCCCVRSCLFLCFCLACV
jgi:hypothetical protein